MKTRKPGILSGLFKVFVFFAVLTGTVPSCKNGGESVNKVIPDNETGQGIQSDKYFSEGKPYVPKFWVEGIYNDGKGGDERRVEEIEKAVENVARVGWDGRGPFIVGDNGKFLVTATSLNWEVAFPISDLLAGCGIKPSSNVWGIAGRDVTALIAIETTELDVTIPGLKDGSKVHVVVWDRMKEKNQRRFLPTKHHSGDTWMSMILF